MASKMPSGGIGVPTAKKFLIESSLKFSDLGGIEGIVKDIRENVMFPIRHGRVYEHLGITPPRGILLYGPPGCGKTALAHAICGEMEDVPFYKISGPEIVSSYSGASEENIRALFKEAEENCPAIIFIDEIDSVAGKRESAGKEMEKRIVA